MDDVCIIAGRYFDTYFAWTYGDIIPEHLLNQRIRYVEAVLGNGKACEQLREWAEFTDQYRDREPDT